MRERINFSDYWRERPRLKKAIVLTPMIIRELCEFSWLIYGNVLYFSDESESCSKKYGGYMFVMFLFLLIGYCKIILYAVIIAIVSYMGVSRMHRKRKS